MMIAVPVIPCDVTDLGALDNEGQPITTGVCATCPKCSATAKAPLRTMTAKRQAIAKLARQCPDRRAGTGTHGYILDQMPDGVRIEYRTDFNGQVEWRPAYWIRRTLHTIAGVVLPGTPVRIVYDKGRNEEAAKIWRSLVKAGYNLTGRKPPEKPKPSKTPKTPKQEKARG